DHELDKLIQWLSTSTPESVFSTQNLAADFPEAVRLKDRLSGLLAVSLTGHYTDGILWFRPEVLQTVDWVGDPYEETELTTEADAAVSSPRRSFEIWKETIKNQSEEWKAHEIKAALHLRTLVVEMILRLQNLKSRDRDVREVEVKTDERTTGFKWINPK